MDFRAFLHTFFDRHPSPETSNPNDCRKISTCVRNDIRNFRLVKKTKPILRLPAHSLMFSSQSVSTLLNTSGANFYRKTPQHDTLLYGYETVLSGSLIRSAFNLCADVRETHLSSTRNVAIFINFFDSNRT